MEDTIMKKTFYYFFVLLIRSLGKTGESEYSKVLTYTYGEHVQIAARKKF
jgi:hypothetical protein